MNHIFKKLSLVTFITLVCFCVSSYSQEKCNLQLKAYEFKDDGTSEQFPVKDFGLKLFETQTDKQIKLENDKSPIIKNLEENSYTLIVSKKGFQKTLTKLKLICNSADLDNNVSKIVFLWEGDSNKTFKSFFEGVTGTTRVKAKDDEKSEIPDINKNAVYFGRPVYPIVARQIGAKGTVQVEVILDELGYVISAKAISGHPILKGPSVTAAKESKFKMTYLDGIPVKVTGLITYIYN